MVNVLNLLTNVVHIPHTVIQCYCNCSSATYKGQEGVTLLAKIIICLQPEFSSKLVDVSIVSRIKDVIVNNCNQFGFKDKYGTTMCVKSDY